MIVKKLISLDMYIIYVFKINLIILYNVVLRYLIIFLIFFFYILWIVLVGMKDLSLYGYSIMF